MVDMEDTDGTGASSSASGPPQGEFIPGFSYFTEYSQALVSRVMAASKNANGLPQAGDDYEYYSSFPGFQTFCSKMTTRIDRIVSKIIRHEQLPCYWGVEEEGEGPDKSRLEDKFETLIEANDLLLERASMILDEAAGLRKNIEQPLVVGGVTHGTAEVASWNLKRDAVRKQVGKFKFIHSRNVPRPQIRFQDQVDNSNNPFVPRLKTKPNAKVPLPDVYEKLVNPTSLSALIANAKEWAGSGSRMTHPYKYELDDLEFLPSQMEIKEPEPPGNLEDTPLTYIDTLAQLEALKEELKKVTEFAIDLEHHSYRTFLGFTCLMQISTRCHDYLIDTLEVRHHMHLLLDPFTDPNIVKVMHGAEFDIHWMQRDFGLYVVNLFDTGQASRVLNLPKFGLSFLLQYCCSITADKQYQLADWRIRPLPQEMIQYARDDTHYLLYIYDRMKNELIRRHGDQETPLLLLLDVLHRSREVCLRLYIKPTFSKTSYLELFKKHKKRFNSQQLHCLQLLCAWRDHLAREEDESMGYVLPNHMLFQIAEILPREPGGVLACCNPIPILLRQQQQEVFLLVQKARETPPTDHLPMDFEPEEVNSDLKEIDSRPLGQARENKGGGGGGGRIDVFVTGPPVQLAKSVVEIIIHNAHALPEERAKKISEIHSTIPSILDQYQKPAEMTAQEVMVQQRLAYESLARAAQIRESPPPPHKTTPLSDKDPPPSDETGETRKGKRKLSLREMGQDKTPRQGTKVNKKPRLSDTPSEDFRPFSYDQSSYTKYGQGNEDAKEVYDPHSKSGHSQKGNSASVPYSRVKQKSAQKSYTYTPRGRGGRGRQQKY